MSSYRPEPNAHISKHDFVLFQQLWHRLPTVHLQEVNRTSSPQNTTRDIPEACSLPGVRLFIYT